MLMQKAKMKIKPKTLLIKEMNKLVKLAFKYLKDQKYLPTVVETNLSKSKQI